MPEPDDKAKVYLDYLDKEMTITGVLSTFCVAVPSLVLERVASAEKNFLAELWISGSWYFMLASVLMLVAAGIFYKQRSLLAWYYGQISLKLALPSHATREVDAWLIDADSWSSWIPYNAAFWVMMAATCEYVLAVLSAFRPIFRGQKAIGIVPIAILVVLLIPWLLILAKYRYEDKPGRAWLCGLFKSKSR